jgi:molybdate transport system substrate-binding protein
MLYTDKGLRFVGPLPAEVQNYTEYVAVALAGSSNREGGRKLLDYIGSPGAKRIFSAKGIE